MRAGGRWWEGGWDGRGTGTEGEYESTIHLHLYRGVGEVRVIPLFVNPGNGTVFMGSFGVLCRVWMFLPTVT